MNHFVLIADAILFIIVFIACAAKGIITRKMLVFIPISSAISFFVAGLLSHAEQIFIDNLEKQHYNTGNVLVFISTILMTVLSYFCLSVYSKVIGERFPPAHKILISTIVGLSFPYCIVVLVSINAH